MLKHKEEVSKYYKKFQKYEKWLEILMYIYKEQRKIYNATIKKGERIEPIIEDRPEVTPVEDNKEESDTKVVELNDENNKKDEGDVEM